MHVVVAASGEIDDHPPLHALVSSADVVVAADGGLRHLDVLGIAPAVVVGDFDSVPAELVAAAERSGAVIERHPVAKDETDLELALLAAVTRGATVVTVIGLFGGRLDHELANVALIAARRWFDAGVTMAAVDATRHLWVVHDELALARAPGDSVSLLPWAGDAVGVTSTGVRWPLDRATLTAGTPRGMSNVVTASDQTFRVEQGVLLVVVDHSERQPAG